MGTTVNRRDLLRASALLCGTIRLGLPGAARASGERDALLATVNPQLRTAAGLHLDYFGKGPPLSAATLAQQRVAMAGYSPKPAPDIPFRKMAVPGRGGQPQVAVWVVNAKRDGRARPAILHTHGGGFVTGTAEQAVAGLQDVCRKLDCVAVSVDYRLAPETGYAGSIEDNYAGLAWLHANAAQLGVDPKRIAVMGESAGGGHAALLAIAARDRGEFPVCFQCLTYPMLDDRTGTTRPVPAHVGRILWTAAGNRFGWASFLGGEPGGADVPARAVPARTRNLAGLPPAWIGVGSIDLFCDEDVDYARRLNDAGVATELIVVPGAFHGFDSSLTDAEIARWFVAARLDALRRAFGLPVA